MNKDRIQGRWRQLKGRLREHWGRLIGDDFEAIAGKREQFLGRLQERHGMLRDQLEKPQAERQVRSPDFRFED
ncbi:CsbD family protein [Acidovorax sp. Be4]|uniref:CsbD family protein n=1 Tax=Acidovorax bellezanensis TaxID=2976702 RepID=A0ABT2PM25_9BURK|nr:CsbD family protein [Acidovorax sp. Be4]MCT9811278.1 CsbD family protein [Acidovorax sp. Be4]